MNQMGPNDAFQQRSRRAQRRFERRSDTMSVLLTAALLIGLYAAWSDWRAQEAPAAAAALSDRRHAAPGLAGL